MEKSSRACNICGNVLLTALNEVSGESQTLSCLMCAGKRNCDKPGTTVQDPGEAYFSGKGAVAVAEPKVAVKIESRPISDPLNTALEAMRQLPMPEDVKQFKKIKKIISLIEEIRDAN